jgi:iron complex outermembrane receptor protein
MTATIEGIAASRVFANDANTFHAPGYGIANVRVSAAITFPGGMRLLPVVGIQNVFDRRYVGSLSVNAAPPPGAPATASRFFEPAPGRTLFVGTSLEMR